MYLALPAAWSFRFLAATRSMLKPSSNLAAFLPLRLPMMVVVFVLRERAELRLLASGYSGRLVLPGLRRGGIWRRGWPGRLPAGLPGCY